GECGLAALRARWRLWRLAVVFDAIGALGVVVLTPGLETTAPAPGIVTAAPLPVVVPPVVVPAPVVVVVSPPVIAFSIAAVSCGVVVSVPPPLPLLLEAQVDVVMVLFSSVTAAVCASSLPWIVAPVFAVMLSAAMIVPTKCVPVPSVAEEPTCQKTLHACAPFMRETLVLEPVVKVEPIWKMNTAFGLPSALRVTLPDERSNELLAS